MSGIGGKPAIKPRVNYAKNGNLIARYQNRVLPLNSPLIPMPEFVILADLDFAKSGVFVLWFLNDRNQEQSLGP